MVFFSMPFTRPQTTFAGLTTPACLRFMIRWTECLHGNGSVRETLINFSDLALAEVVHLYRVNTATGGQRSIATIDLCASQGARPLTWAHGIALAGQTISRAKPGTLWSLQELDREAASRLDSRVADWMEERGLREAMMIPLSSVGDATDLLEFYLSTPLDRPRRVALETLTLAAAEAWGRRPTGRIARILRAAPAINEHLSNGRPNVHPLSESNPLGLTAAELRICSMMHRGTNLNEASKTLGIADSTLRTHLRSIFAKAGVAGQVGLVRLLLEPQATRLSLRA
jgi:DNA-binding CsgD family transcriptional regulator